MRCIVLVQSRWRIKKSRFLALVLGARHKLRTIAAVKIQRIALGYAGRKRAKLRSNRMTHRFSNVWSFLAVPTHIVNP